MFLFQGQAPKRNRIPTPEGCTLDDHFNGFVTTLD
jgi:hypothetical protein